MTEEPAAQESASRRTSTGSAFAAASLSGIAEIIDVPPITKTDAWLSLDPKVSSAEFKVSQHNAMVAQERTEFLLREILKLQIMGTKKTTTTTKATAVESKAATVDKAAIKEFVAIIEAQYNMLRGILRQHVEDNHQKEYVTVSKNTHASAKAFYKLLCDEVPMPGASEGTTEDPLFVAPDEEDHPLLPVVRMLKHNEDAMVQFYIKLCAIAKKEDKNLKGKKGKGKEPAQGQSQGAEDGSQGSRRSERLMASSQ